MSIIINNPNSNIGPVIESSQSEAGKLISSLSHISEQQDENSKFDNMAQNFQEGGRPLLLYKVDKHNIEIISDNITKAAHEAFDILLSQSRLSQSRLSQSNINSNKTKLFSLISDKKYTFKGSRIMKNNINTDKIIFKSIKSIN